MAAKYIKCKTPGVRYREHPERKHGIKPDRYFFIRYKVEGKDREEALGWSSEGVTEQKASERLAEIKRNIREGQGFQSLAEKRAIAKAEREAEEREKARLSAENLTVGQFFTETYLPHAQQDKPRATWRRDEELFRLWASPVIGNVPLKAVSPFHLERIKRSMSDAGRAARSVHYCLAIIRQIFNHARRLDLFVGDNPVGKVKKPSEDNRRMRFLTHEEAEQLLDGLAKKSRDVHDQALLSLHCGLRAGEVFALTWADVDMNRGMLAIKDTKSKRNRTAIMTSMVKDMLKGRGPSAPTEYVFPAKGGKKTGQVSQTFIKVVNVLGFNADVLDARQKIVFHSLRHTYASWLVEQGVDLYVVAELMGHETLAMTKRYAHLSPSHLHAAVKALEASLGKAKTGKVVDIASAKR